MFTHAEYDVLQTRIAALKQWLDTSPLVHRSRNGSRSYADDAVPSTSRVSNEEQSAVEVYDFYHNPPQRYFGYVALDLSSITTWTGDTLAHVTDAWPEWRSNFGDTRQTLDARGINGLQYRATHYKSAGGYCRMNMKEQKP